MAELEPTTAEWQFGRASALSALGDHEAALAIFDAALPRQPNHAQAINDRALALSNLGRYEEAFAGFARAAELEPNFAGAHWNEALCRLLLGQFDVGWRKYEWRWKKSEFRKAAHPFRQPRWTGAEDIAGKRILLFGEQGLGDVIQFCRYAPLVAERGASVLVAAHPSLKPLLQTLDAVDGVLGNGEPLPPFDFQCPLMSLPLVFETRVDTIPSRVPYLRTDPLRLRHWSERLGSRSALRVGLAWSGDPRLAHDSQRSIPLDVLRPLFGLNAEFVCLSKFVREGDAQKMQSFGIRHFGDELTDFAETAALATQMDLVIAVDTSIAHLAGALALPLWLLIADPPEYRWMLEREDSPWYPTARLFRQQTGGDWPAVIARVVRALDNLIANRLSNIDGRRP